MPAKILILFLGLFSASCIRQPTSSDSADTPPPPCTACSSAVLLDAHLFDSLVISDSLTSMVEFYSPLCPVCVSLEPMVDSLAIVYGDRALVGKVNTDEDTVLWKRYTVLSVPTFLFFKHGTLMPVRYSETLPDTLSRVLDSLLLNP